MTVQQKQCLLAYLGYYNGAVDGIWGNQSQSAAEAFQRDYQLTIGDDIHARILVVIASGEIPTISQGAPQEAPTAPESGKTGTFWDDIPNFTRQEFSCPCPRCNGFPVEPAERLARAAQALRDDLGEAMHVTSGVRCQAHNDELKGSVPNSRHVIGHAMDFRVDGMTSAQVLPRAKATPGIVYAYAIDEMHVHMDIGG